MSDDRSRMGMPAAEQEIADLRAALATERAAHEKSKRELAAYRSIAVDGDDEHPADPEELRDLLMYANRELGEERGRHDMTAMRLEAKRLEAVELAKDLAACREVISDYHRRRSEHSGAADKSLMESWRRLRDGLGTNATDSISGAIDVLFDASILDAKDVELWRRRITTCPGHDDEGGRDWCAYCGKMVK